MIKDFINNGRGQTALVLILFSAAALVLLAVTLNWGRIAQTKTLLSIAAYQSAAMLASDAASYGEEQKQTYLKNTNKVTEQTGILLAILMVVIAVIVFFIPGLQGISYFLAAASVGMATINLVLQLVVVQPGITSLWNSLQKDQPIQQQFYEQGGIVTALEGSVGDQVNITDYLAWNDLGVFGLSATGVPNDVVSRFAVYYTDRLKMLNQKPIPQVAAFYNAVSELMNGESCDQNISDVSLFGAAPNPACAGLDCAVNPIDPVCEIKIPGGFQLNDACPSSSLTPGASYNPYCDPCCQPLTVPGSNPSVNLRPVSNCSQSPVPKQCYSNNPYNSSPGSNDSPYPLLYDSTYQNYGAGLSFLAQLGRDQQKGTSSNGLTPKGEFPNGVYPLFWLMNSYSPEVDNINPALSLSASQAHWCTSAVAGAYTAPAGFTTLTQLTLPYTCSGQDCCVNYLANASNGVIDDVGASIPTTDKSFGEKGTGSWLQGDNELCLNSWPYNGSPEMDMSHGTCQWTNSPTVPSGLTPGVSTVDNLDDVMHALSDFDNFANTFLHNNTTALSSTFDSWYDQAFSWIDPVNGRLPPLVGTLNSWHTVMSNWLAQTYTNSNAWCVPPQNSSSLNYNNSPTAENNYIASSGGTGPWGDLPHVLACLNYNAKTSVNNFQACANLMTGTCPASPTNTACDPATLGRSLAGAIPAWDGCAGNYAAWVQKSLTAATNQAPKFALRSQFLNDVYTRANTLQNISNAGYQALSAFLKPCGATDTSCQTGGPAAQLMWANAQPAATTTLPNSVIYGWVDNTYSNGQPGHAHIVKVTAYAPGRNGYSSLANSKLPWIKTTTSGWLSLTRSYTLTDRDGFVYVSIKRWDEDHNPVLFPNGHTLWQSMFHVPGGTTTTGQGLMQACNGVPINGGGHIGFGLLLSTAQGLGYAKITSQDQQAMANAFMLNGSPDPYAKSNAYNYQICLNMANYYLSSAPESHACAEYIASRNASGPSGDKDSDYSLKFVDCNSVGGYPPPDDLT